MKGSNQIQLVCFNQEHIYLLRSGSGSYQNYEKTLLQKIYSFENVINFPACILTAWYILY